MKKEFQLKHATLIPIMVLLASGTSAEEAIRGGGFVFGHDLGLAQISSDTNFFVETSDRVSDGCWLNSARTTSMIKRELVDAGFVNIVDEYSFGVTIRISAMGYETNDFDCAVYTELEVGITDTDQRDFEESVWTLFKEKEAFESGSLMTGAKSEMSERILSNFEGYIDELIVAIQISKNRLRNEILEFDTTDQAKAELLNVISR